MKISLIITTKNEDQHIGKLLSSIAKQTRRPDEIIVANVGTLEKYSSAALGILLRIIELPLSANRSVGRNAAIKAARYEHILITDAGCKPHKHWIEKMILGFEQADVVAGVAWPDAKTIFEKCAAPYALVMPDRVNVHSFLPATRNMGITKSIWKKMRGFNEQYRFAEDYEFARRLKREKIPIVTMPEAIVYWRSRSSLTAFTVMIFQHARGDAEAHSWRPKVWSVFARYIIFLMLAGASTVSSIFFFFLLQSLMIYIVYSVAKNYRYVNHPKAFFYLPVLQLISDGAVMIGTVYGILS